jgi:hypothetical protein
MTLCGIASSGRVNDMVNASTGYELSAGDIRVGVSVIVSKTAPVLVAIAGIFVAVS